MTNYAATRGSVWNAFVKAVPACNSTVGTNTTIDCLRNANLDVATLTRATVAGVLSSTEEYPFVPALGDDVYPALPSKPIARLPLAANANGLLF